MRRPLALVLVCALVLSSVSLAAPTTGERAVAPVTPATNTTAYLDIAPDALESAAYRRTTLDVSGTLALDTRGLSGRFTQLSADARFDATASTAARRGQLTAIAGRIERDIARLHERQSAAIRGYNNGSLPAREFVLELAAIDTAAGQLDSAVARVADRARSVPRFAIRGQPAANWENNRRIELDTLEGPVRDRIGDAIRGRNTRRTDGAVPSGLDRIGPTDRARVEPLRVYVETSSDGLVLATVAGGVYYREASLPGERNATGEGVEGIGAVSDRVAERYPWASNNSGTTELSGDREAGLYQVSLYHRHGRLTTYLDRDSGRVFAEQQQKDLANVPTTPVTATRGGLRLAVNRTHPTGPLELSLTRDGQPVDGHLTIDNQSLGPTGEDGRLWAVAPRGEFVITARADGRTVRVETSAPVSNRTTLGVPVAA